MTLEIYLKIEVYSSFEMLFFLQNLIFFRRRFGLLPPFPAPRIPTYSSMRWKVLYSKPSLLEVWLTMIFTTVNSNMNVFCLI